MMILQGKEIISKEILTLIITYTMRNEMKRYYQKSRWHNKDLSNKLKFKRLRIINTRFAHDLGHI